MIEEVQRSLQRDGVRLVYRVARRAGAAGGARGAVVLLHGLASNLTRFSEFVEHTSLAASRDLLRPDLRGHGLSLTRGRVGLQLWCDDVLAMLQAEGHGAALLVGHSLGAQVALHFAARYRRSTEGLVLIDPVFRQALHGRWRLLARAGPLLRLAAAGVRGANALGLHRRQLPPLDLRELDALARRALATPESERAFIRQYSSTRADLRYVPLAVYLQDLAEMFRPVPDVRALAVPVLALLSTGATFADAEQMRALLAGPTVVVQSIDCHHWPLTERPVQVREAIERWCAALGAAPGSER